MKNSPPFTKNDSRNLDQFFKALANETRRQILRMLIGGERTVGEIVADFHLSQPTISRHLSILKQADLVADRRKGQKVRYRLRRRQLMRRAEQFFRNFDGDRTRPLRRGRATRAR